MQVSQAVGVRTGALYPDRVALIVLQQGAVNHSPHQIERPLVQRFHEETPMGGGCEVSGATQNTVDAIGAVSRNRCTRRVGMFDD